MVKEDRMDQPVGRVAKERLRRRKTREKRQTEERVM